MKRSSLRSAFVLFLCVLFLLTPSTSSASYLNLVSEKGSVSRKLSAWQTDDTWFVDLHDFFQTLEFSVNWDAGADRLSASRDGTSMKFRPRTNRVLVDDRTLELVSPPRIHEGRMYLPASAVTNLINRHTGKSMIWNPARRQLQVASAAAWAQDRTDDPIGSFIETMPEKDKDDMLVIIDPGHGGRDPGAIGHNGIKEKRVVLEISKQIKHHLKQNYKDMKIRLTRSTDKFIPLSRRTQIANDVNGDVFLSIHANSSRSTRASGFEVYTLSGEATDPSARELAKIENSALRYEGIQGKKLDDITFILHQLTQTVNSRESNNLAGTIMKKAEKILPISTRRARQAPFWVLKDARMPAILVETGFLSNPAEEKMLQTESYQKSVAKVIGQALKQYRANQFQ